MAANNMRLSVLPEEHATHLVPVDVTSADAASTLDRRNNADDQWSNIVLVHDIASNRALDSLVDSQISAIGDTSALDVTRSPTRLLTSLSL